MNDALPTSSDPFALRYAQTFASSPRNATIDSLLAHRSVRAFTHEKLPPRTLETLIAAGQSAATSSNLQTWSVVAIEDGARRQELMRLGDNQTQIAEAPLTLCFIADLSRLAAIADRIGRRREALDYLEMFLVAAIDSALAAQNVCVAAESMGLATCYLGVLRNRPEEMAAFLKLPPMAAVTFGLSIGFPDAARRSEVKPRLAQSSVLHRETYDSAQALAPVADYETALDAFNSRARNGQPLWSLRSAGRVAGPESLSGRDRLKLALRQLGFSLK